MNEIYFYFAGFKYEQLLSTLSSIDFFIEHLSFISSGISLEDANCITVIKVYYFILNLYFLFQR